MFQNKMSEKTQNSKKYTKTVTWENEYILSVLFMLMMCWLFYDSK